MAWVDGPLVAYALATTGTDPSTARLVAVAHRTINDGTNGPATVHLIIQDTPIPADSTAVHHITTERCARGGLLGDVLVGLHQVFTAHAANQAPLVLFNSTWVMAVLRAETTRAGLDLIWPANLPVVDPAIIDKHLTPARAKGNRTLPALCSTWGVPHEQYGTPSQNADAALHLAWQMGHRVGAVRDLSVSELVNAQRTWWRQDRDEHAAYVAAQKARSAA